MGWYQNLKEDYIPDAYDLVHTSVDEDMIIALLLARIDVLEKENYEIRANSAAQQIQPGRAGWVDGTEDGERVLAYRGQLINLGVIPKPEKS